MNLVFHTVFSISTSSLCAKKVKENDKPIKYLTIGFIGNFICHGIMDLIPHNYPITLISDLSVSFLIFLLSMIFVKRRFIFSVFFCFLGGVLPDLIDKALFPLVGFRDVKVFPWHWPIVINFFYQWYSPQMFKVFDILVIVISLSIIVLNIKFIIQHMVTH